MVNIVSFVPLKRQLIHTELSSLIFTPSTDGEIISSRAGFYSVEPNNFISTPIRPNGGVAIDGDFLWIVDTNTPYTFYRINKLTGATDTSFSIPSSPFHSFYGIQEGTDGTFLWVLCRRDDSTHNNVSRIEKISKSGSIVESIDLSFAGAMGIHFDGTFFWIGSNTGILRKLNTSYNVVNSWDLSGFMPYIASLYHDGTYLWLTGDEGSFIKYDPDTSTFLGGGGIPLTLGANTRPTHWAWDGAGHFYSSEVNELYITDYNVSPSLSNNLQSVDSITWTSRMTANYVDDTFSLGARIVNGATILAAADSSGTFQNGANITSNAYVDYGPYTFPYINSAATKLDWEQSTLELRQNYTQNMGADGARISIDKFTLGGTYTQSIVEEFGASVVSAMSTANTVGNILPRAPTLVAPTQGATIDMSTGYTFDWIHNDPDADPQVSYRFHRRREG